MRNSTDNRTIALRMPSPPSGPANRTSHPATKELCCVRRFAVHRGANAWHMPPVPLEEAFTLRAISAGEFPSAGQGGTGSPVIKGIAPTLANASRLKDNMSVAMVRLLAGLMAGVGAYVWLVISRWERPGRSAELRARLRAPPLIGVAGDVAQVAPLLYPVLVVIAPGWAYESWANWSSSIDVILQVAGLGLWVLGMTLLLWASHALGQYLSVNGVAVDHELVTRGPYRYVRHPVYASFAAIAAGTTLVFRSYVLLGLSVVWILSSAWWVAAEERLFASSDGFGDAYRRYASQTGRFLPRVRRARGQQNAP